MNTFLLTLQRDESLHTCCASVSSSCGSYSYSKIIVSSSAVCIMLTARMQRISFVGVRSRLGLVSTPANRMTHAEGVCVGGVIRCTRVGTGSPGHRVNGSSVSAGLPGHRVIIVTRYETRIFSNFRTNAQNAHLTF